VVLLSLTNRTVGAGLNWSALAIMLLIRLSFHFSLTACECHSFLLASPKIQSWTAEDQRPTRQPCATFFAFPNGCYYSFQLSSSVNASAGIRFDIDHYLLQLTLPVYLAGQRRFTSTRRYWTTREIPSRSSSEPLQTR